MHEYKLTGRAETDRCLKLANMAHRYYFSDPLLYAKEFAETTKAFIEAIEEKYILYANRTDPAAMRKKQVSELPKKNKFEEAIRIFYRAYNNEGKAEYLITEMSGIYDRLNIIIKNPSLINRRTLFVLDQTARFIEEILPEVCGVKEEVVKNSKFNSDDITNKEFKFFHLSDSENTEDKYLQVFYDGCWRTQKNVNGFEFMGDYLNLANSTVEKFFKNYGGRDYFASLIFARMANEQFMKYLTAKHSKFWACLGDCIDDKYLGPEQKDKIIASRDVDNKAISVPLRVNALVKAGVLNELIAREVKLVNARGNNIAHQGDSAFFSSCYHNLELLNYLNLYCR